MARAPAPPDWKSLSFHLTVDNDRFLEELQRRHSRNATETLARELDFLRLWGMSALRVRRLIHAAKAEGATIFQYVTNVLARGAAELPPAPLPPETPPSNEKVRGNLNFNGFAQEFVNAYAAAHGATFSAAVDQLISFARTYNLTRGQYAALEAHAFAQGGTTRDVVLDIIADHAARLPEPPQVGAGTRHLRSHAKNTTQ